MMKCKHLMDALLRGVEFDDVMRSHLDGCQACRSRQSLVTQLEAVGNASRDRDLPEAVRRETRESVLALLNETEASPARPWILRPIAISGGALAAAIVLAIMAINTVLTRHDDVAPAPQANIPPGPSGPAVFASAELDDSFDDIRDSLSAQIVAFRARHDLGDSSSVYALHVGRLSDRMAMMKLEFASELTTFMPRDG